MLKTLLNKIFNFDEFASILGRNVKNDLRIIKADFQKVMRVIRSCKHEEHLAVANRLITHFYMKYEDDYLLDKLEIRYNLMKKVITQ